MNQNAFCLLGVLGVFVLGVLGVFVLGVLVGGELQFAPTLIFFLFEFVCVRLLLCPFRFCRQRRIFHHESYLHWL